MKKLVLLLAAVSLSISVVLGLAIGGREADKLQSQGDGDWGDFFDAANLVAASELIIIGQLRSEHTEDVVFPSSSNPSARFIRRDLIQEFEAGEVIKGNFIDKTINVRLTIEHSFSGTAGNSRGSRDLSVVKLEEGRRYVLFLVQYPVGDGRTAWGPPGEPGLAELEGDSLIFRGTQRYEHAVREKGLSRASPRSEAPFELNLSELRRR